MAIDPGQRGIGVRFNPQGLAEVRLWAPKAKLVELVIKERSIVIPLEEQDFGYWQLSTSALKPGDCYLFRLDGEKERPDPASLQQLNTVHGPSVATDPGRFLWEDHDWKNIPLEDLILYELHTGTFTPEGTFAGIGNKLDHLLKLGINAIEIMPVAQFPGGRNWGYDGVLPFAVQNSYGGAEGLQHLVNACHKKGIAVILDVVYNHVGPEGSYLSDFGYYFTDKYRTPWGNAINFDDAWCDAVRAYFIENALMWLRDFHIDGLRLDAVHAIRDFSPVHILRQLKLEVDKLVKKSGRKHHLIVELDLNDPRFIEPLGRQGYGMEAQWLDEFHHALRVTAGQEPAGYYSDFNGLEHLAKAYRDAYVFDGQYSPHRKRKFGVKTNNPGSQFIVFCQNHDQVGNRMLGERTSKLVSFEIQKLMIAAILISPYIPMLFMGEEYSEPNPFQYFVSHSTPELIEAVRKGRKEEFADFHLSGEAPDPFDAETFNRSKLQWELLKKEPHKTMLQFYQTLIRLRKTHPVLKNLNRQNLDVAVNELKQVLTLRRWEGKNRILAFMNFSDKQQSVEVPATGTRYRKLLDSASEQWKGPQDAAEYIGEGRQVRLQPESILIYSGSD